MLQFHASTPRKQASRQSTARGASSRTQHRREAVVREPDLSAMLWTEIRSRGAVIDRLRSIAGK
jgi:hypothetical protein